MFHGLLAFLSSCFPKWWESQDKNLNIQIKGAFTMKYLSSFERFFIKANKTNPFGENASNFNVVRSIYCHRYLAFMKPFIKKASFCLSFECFWCYEVYHYNAPFVKYFYPVLYYKYPWKLFSLDTWKCFKLSFAVSEFSFFSWISISLHIFDFEA